MSYLKSCLLMVFIFPLALNGQNLLKNGDAETALCNWNGLSVQVVTESPHSGKNCFKTISTNVETSEFIPVDTAKKYKLSGWFKSADDKKTNLYLGLIPFDADKKQIEVASVNVVEDSATELAEACAPGDTAIKVKDASKAIKNAYHHIAFATDNSGAYKDLPNSNISGIIVKVEKKDSLWEITLDKPCGKTYSANTPIRLQKDAGTYMYPVYSGAFQSSEWQELSGEVNGEAKSSAPSNQFWPRTKYVKVLILALGGGMLYFDDVNFEEVK